MLQGHLSYIHFGTPCADRRKRIKKHQKARTKERVACELAFFTLRLIEAAMSVGTFRSVENPSSSMLWELVPFRHLAMCDDVFSVEFPMCAYGTSYKKNTKLLTNFHCHLSLQRVCGHSRHVQTFCGKTKVRQVKLMAHIYENLTELAGAYPQMLAETWASWSCNSPSLAMLKRSLAQLLGNSTGRSKQQQSKPTSVLRSSVRSTRFSQTQ